MAAVIKGYSPAGRWGRAWKKKRGGVQHLQKASRYAKNQCINRWLGEPEGHKQGCPDNSAPTSKDVSYHQKRDEDKRPTERQTLRHTTLSFHTKKPSQGSPGRAEPGHSPTHKGGRAPSPPVTYSSGPAQTPHCCPPPPLSVTSVSASRLELSHYSPVGQQVASVCSPEGAKHVTTTPTEPCSPHSHQPPTCSHYQPLWLLGAWCSLLHSRATPRDKYAQSVLFAKLSRDTFSGCHVFLSKPHGGEHTLSNQPPPPVQHLSDGGVHPHRPSDYKGACQTPSTVTLHPIPRI